MSKMDALRAMREARYAEDQARAAGKPAAKRAPVAPTVRTSPAAAKSASAQMSPDAPVQTDELCGHRNMGGKTCTREKGHTAKNHRYS